MRIPGTLEKWLIFCSSKNGLGNQMPGISEELEIYCIPGKRTLHFFKHGCGRAFIISG